MPAEQLVKYDEFAAWVKEQAGHCGLKANVEFVAAPLASTVADCTAMTEHPTIQFNTAHLQTPPAFFRPPFGRTGQLELVIHELGYALTGKPSDHGPAWGRGVAKAGARIAAAKPKQD